MKAAAWSCSVELESLLPSASHSVISYTETLFTHYVVCDTKKYCYIIEYGNKYMLLYLE